MSKKMRTVLSVLMTVLILTLVLTVLVCKVNKQRDGFIHPITRVVKESAPISDKQRFEGEIVTLKPSGFEPREITRGSGPFVLTVENNSGMPVTPLMLTSESGGPPFHQVSVARETRNWSEIFDLPPGSYTLKDVRNRNHVCGITIR